MVDKVLIRFSLSIEFGISALYDNEWGFANRMCDLAVYLGNLK